MDWNPTINAVSFDSVAAEPVTTGNPHIFTNPLVEQSTWIPYESSFMIGGQPSTFMGSIPPIFIEPNHFQHEQGQPGTLGLMNEDGETEDGPEKQDGSEDDDTDEEEEEEEEDNEDESKEEDKRGAES